MSLTPTNTNYCGSCGLMESGDALGCIAFCKVAIGDRVATIGATGEDADAGEVVAIDGSEHGYRYGVVAAENVMVAWDSGVRTIISTRDVRVIV